MSFLQRLYQGLFARRITLSNQERALLQHMYPTIDWAYVRCWEGLPWFVRQGVVGIAMPSTYSSRFIDLYFLSYLPHDEESIATLVHEAFHALQYHDLNSVGNQQRWYNVGLFRPFMLHYCAWFIAGWVEYFFKERYTWARANYAAYRFHPLEMTAYKHEFNFQQHSHLFTPTSDIADLFYQSPDLLCLSSNYAELPPRWAWWLGAILLIILTISKPIMDWVLTILLLPYIAWRWLRG